MTDMITAGDDAPAFTAPRDGGETVSLSDYAGKTVVLYFYPKDDTSGCTTEALEFTAMGREFEQGGAVVLGVSKDSVKKHDRFRDKHSLGVILVSDSDTSIAEDYGVWKEKSMYGKTYMGIERSTFVIDGAGVVRHAFRKVKAAGHAAQVLDAVKALA
jgi:peroxiredoxin Q/BCP